MYMTSPNPIWETGIKNNTNRPLNFDLGQNYPNPFNARTTISFTLKEAAPVTIDVFNLLGAQVATLADEVMEIGPHSIVWDASEAASGIYYYRLSTGDQSETRQAVMIK